MRIFKSQYVTPLVSVFDDGKRLHCVVTAIFHASFSGELREERELWLFATDEVEGMVLDEGKPKPRGEYLVHGSCYARGPDVRQSFVKVQIGSQEKVLAVFGPRTFLTEGPSDPEPFDVVPIRFTHAFGGPGFDQNPVGMGAKGGAAPQVEVRSKLVRHAGDKPPVAGLGRVDVERPQRMSRMGTYDDRYMKTRYPGVAEDFDGSFFQLALPDQWRDDFFEGSEPFSVVNMHPEEELREGRLPGIVARVFVKRAGEELVDVPMHIDTVHLFPHRERQVVICRGTTTTKSDTLADIEEVGLGLEWIGRPKPRSHYEEVFAARRKKRGGLLASLNDTSLLPEEALPARPKERLVAPGEGLKQRTMERRLEHRIAEARKILEEHQLDTSMLDKLPTHLDLSVDPDDAPRRDELPTQEGIEKKIAAARDATLARIREEAEKSGASAEQMKEIDALAKKLEKGPVGPPTMTRDATREKLEEQATLLRNAGLDASAIEAQLEDRDLDERLRRLDEFARESYRKHVQHQAAAPALDGASSEEIRKLVLARVGAGEPLTGLDLTGADLSGLDLRGAKAPHAFLESVDLTGANLEGADFEAAVLARAKLRGADLTRSTLTRANLSEADLRGADLSGLDLSGGFFVGADLTSANLSRAKLDRVDFGGASLHGTDLSQSTASRLKLRKLSFDHVVMRDVTWDRAQIYECRLTDVDARGSDLPNLAIIDSHVERCRFDDARMPKLRAARALGKTALPGCSFVGATLHKAHLRGVDLRASDFRHADLLQADFSEADLDDSTFDDARAVGARFVGATLRRCRFDRVDLMDGLLGAAVMDHASFESANLYRADFGRSQGPGVKMTGANVKWVRTVPKREESP